jgi:hypothetical protein
MSNDRIRANRARPRALAEGARLAGQRLPAPGGHAAPRAAGSPMALWPWDTTPPSSGTRPAAPSPGRRVAGRGRPAPGGHAAPRAAGSAMALWPWDTTRSGYVG